MQRDEATQRTSQWKQTERESRVSVSYLPGFTCSGHFTNQNCLCLTSSEWESAINYLCGAFTNSSGQILPILLLSLIVFELYQYEVRFGLLERSFRRIFLLYFEYISEPPLSYFYLSKEVESALLLLSVFFKNFFKYLYFYLGKERVDPAVTRPSFSPQLFPMTTFTKLEEPWPARATP